MRDLKRKPFCLWEPFRKGDVWELHRPPAPAETKGKFVTTASMYLAVTLSVEQLPREGLQIRADDALSSPGGGYVVAAGVRAQGVETWVTSALGTGPNSHSLRRSLVNDGIEHFATALVGDVGVGVTMVEGDGKASIVIAPGVEAEPSSEILDRIQLEPGDLVHVDGADLSAGPGRDILLDWVDQLPESVSLVVSVSPEVSAVPAKVWMRILKRADIVTMNVREASALTELLATAVPGTGPRHVLRMGAAVVRRTGPMGCEVQTSLSAPLIQLPAFRTKPVDTTGVGDTHVAVMCASLLLGYSLPEACNRANAAAALVLSHPTAFPLPSAEQVDEVVAAGKVPSDLLEKHGEAS